jgi:hypothetical protein
LSCGEKTRRGGAQETVRISVLEQLVLDHPAWTLRDVIAHLGGSETCESDDILDGSVSSADEGYRSESPCQLPCPEASETFDSLQLMRATEPLTMEFISPGTPQSDDVFSLSVDRAATVFKREFTTATATSIPDTPYFVDDIHVPTSYQADDTMYLWPTIHPRCLDRSFQLEAQDQFDPPFQAPQLQVPSRLKCL